MAKVRVPITGTIGKSIRINPSATKGATLGVDLRNADGSLVVLSTTDELARLLANLKSQIIDASIIDEAAITAELLAAGAVLEAKLADNAVALAKLDLATFRPVQIVSTLPTLPDATYPVNSIVLLTTDSKIYRNDADVWTAAVPAADLSGTVDLDSQISGTLSTAFAEAGLINTNVTINADGSLTGAGGGQASLTSLPGLVQIGSIVANAITDTELANAAVTINKFGTNLEPIHTVTTLPTLPNGSFPVNTVVLLTTDSTVYRNAADVWIKTVATADLSGTIDLDSQISGTLSTAFAEAGLINTNVTINADGSLSGAGGGQATLNSLTGDLDLNTKVSGTLSTAFAEAGLINTNVTINADGSLSGAGGGQASLTSLPGTVDLDTKVSGTLSTAFAEAGLINTGVSINADGSLTGAGGGQASLTSLPGSVQIGSIAANAVTATEIAALTITAAEIAANTITASQIAAKTITAQNIVLTDNTNMYPDDGDFESNIRDDIWLAQANFSIATTDPKFGTYHGKFTANGSIQDVYATELTPVIPGEKFYFDGWYRTTAGFSSGADIRPCLVQFNDENKANPSWASISAPTVPQTTWTNVTGVITVPAGKFYMKPGFSLRASAVTGDMYLDGLTFRRMNSANLIVDGAILADKIASNAVTTIKLNALAVTTAKIEALAVTAGKIAANTITAGQIAANTITATEIAALTITAAEIAADTITGSQIAALAIDTGELAAGAVTAAKIEALTITAGQIAALTITGGKMVAGAIDTDQLAANAVTAIKIAALTITAAEIAATTITGAKMVANTIDTDQIAANAITSAEIAANTIVAGNIQAGAIDTTELAALAVTAAKIAANTITANEIFAGTITTTEIASATILGGNIAALTIDTGQIKANAITAVKIAVANLAAIKADLGAITAGTLTLDSTGHIKSGQTAYDTGTGFWLGRDGSTSKFSIGDSGANKMSWDGTTLVVRGSVSVGSYIVNTGNVLLAANTERNSSNLSFVEVKKFEINKPGSLNVFFDGKMASIAGGVVTPAQIRVKLDGVQAGATQSFSTASYSNRNVNVTTLATSQFITVEYKAGERNTSEPVTSNVFTRNVQVRCDIEFGESVITD